MLVRRLLWNVVPVALIVSTTGLAMFGREGLLARFELKSRLVATEARIAEMHDDNDALRAAIWRLRNDPRVVDRVRADRMRIAPEGARVVAVPPLDHD